MLGGHEDHHHRGRAHRHPQRRCHVRRFYSMIGPDTGTIRQGMPVRPDIRQEKPDPAQLRSYLTRLFSA